MERYATRVPTASNPPLREARAALTRNRIAEAARDAFLADGYLGTSMTAIATGAGVSVQTIYNVVGNKAAVLSAVLDVVAAGPDAPTPVRAFMDERSRATRTLPELMDLLASWFAEVHPRSADIFHVIRQAAVVDPEVAELEQARASQRLTNYTLAAGHVRARGGLTSGLSDDEAAAVIWSIGHPDVYRFFTRSQGWGLDRYRAWLTTSLSAALR